MEPDPDEHQHPGEEDLEWANEEIKGKKRKNISCFWGIAYLISRIIPFMFNFKIEIIF